MIFEKYVFGAITYSDNINVQILYNFTQLESIQGQTKYILLAEVFRRTLLSNRRDPGRCGSDKVNKRRV